MATILKKLDAYPKINEDFFHKTMAGGVITLVASAVMALLFLNETRLYLATNVSHELVVDTSRGETISINFDVTFPKVPCSWLSLDTMDISGELHLDVDHDVYKQRLTASGQPIKDAERHDVHGTKTESPVLDTTANGTACGPCYGAEDTPEQCCNTCDDVRMAYRKRGWALTNTEHISQCKHDAYLQSISEQRGEGCKMWGVLEVNKVAGNFHFAPGRSYQSGNMHVHDVAPFGDVQMDFSHTVHKLAFGEPYPGMKNPLDGVNVQQPTRMNEHGLPQEASGMFQYFLKVVPTVYKPLDKAGGPNRTVATNQFSVTENFRESQGGMGRSLPGLFFFYDLSPIKVHIAETKSSFLHFITSVCAIVGGVFTVSGIVDACVYRGQQLIKKKMELGKLS